MPVEIEYNNPETLVAGDWQVQVANEAVANSSSSSSLSSITEVERIVDGNTLIVRLPDGQSSTTKTAIRNAIETYLQNAIHVETRTV